MGSLSTDENSDIDGINAATAIFAQYDQFIRAIIRSKIGGEACEEDLLHDFFLSLAHKPPPNGVRNMKSYLYGAITHDIADALRRTDGYRTRLEKYGEESENSINIIESENAFTYDEDVDRVLRLIEKRLPDSQSRAIIFRYKYGYEIKEIAKEMHVNRRSVSRYISVGLRTIRQLLAGKRGNSND